MENKGALVFVLLIIVGSLFIVVGGLVDSPKRKIFTPSAQVEENKNIVYVHRQ